MKRIKKIVRLSILVGLIILASIGIGISGGIPIPFSTNRKDTEQQNLEQIDSKEDNAEMNLKVVDAT